MANWKSRESHGPGVHHTKLSLSLIQLVQFSGIADASEEFEDLHVVDADEQILTLN